MSIENSGDVSYAEIGGLAEQIRELREVDISLYLQSYLLTYSCFFIHSAFQPINASDQRRCQEVSFVAIAQGV